MNHRLMILAMTCLLCNTVFAQQNRTLSDFSELTVSDRITVTLIPTTGENYMEIEGDKIDNFELVQKNDALKLKMALGYPLQGKDLNINLYYKTLNKISARTGATIIHDNGVLTADSLYVMANEGAKISMNIHANGLRVLSTTGGSIELRGETNRQNIDIAFGGNYDAKDLVSKSANASTNAGGRCEIQATDNVDIQTRAGGVVDVYGSPANRKTKKLAGGKITFLD